MKPKKDIFPAGIQSYLIAVNIMEQYSLDLFHKHRDAHRDRTSINFGIGTVLAMGPECYKGERFEESGPWCYLNDYIICDMSETIKLRHKDVDHDIHIINDDQVHWALVPASYDLQLCLRAYMRGWKNAYEK